MPNVDELFKFSTNDGKVETVVMLDPNKISDFPNHPFRIEDNEEMEMVSGHRRNFAAKKAGLNEIPAIIREMTDEEAIVIMVDSNIQREKILISEKAFAYKMKMEALKKQGKRNDLTSCQVGAKIRADEKIAEHSDDSARQIQRYIRLTELIKELLDMVDIGKISFNPAVEISYLSKEEQYMLLDCIKRYDATPSQSQAIFLKKLSQENKLTTEKMEEIMQEEKPNQQPKYSINYNRFEKYLPRNVVTKREVEDFLFKCVEEHYKRLKQRELSR